MTSVESPPPIDPEFVACLLESHRRLTGRALLADQDGGPDVMASRRLYDAPFVVLAHDTTPDPRFTFANRAAQRLFEMPWSEIVGLPSRLSAEAPARQERQRLLDRVATHGYIHDYSGVRISKSGRRFRILRATVWNVHDRLGRPLGQAATFTDWEDLP
jgi:PAS domain-containing protein